MTIAKNTDITSPLGLKPEGSSGKAVGLFSVQISPFAPIDNIK